MATYQSDPWFVAENLTNQNSLRISNFWSNNAPSGYQTVHAGSQVDWNAFMQARSSGKHANLHSIEWNVVGGPYPDEKTAQAAIPGIQNKSPAPGAVQQALQNTPLAGLEGLSHILGDFLTGITDGKMWRSLGWLTLGIILFLGGLALWLKGSLNPLALATGGGHAASNLKGMFGRG